MIYQILLFTMAFNDFATTNICIKSFQIQLESSTENFDPEYFSMAGKGELFLFNDYKRMLGFDATGARVFELVPKSEGLSPFIICNYACLRQNGKQLLVLNMSLEKQSGMIFRVYFYDLDKLRESKNNSFLGYGYDLRKKNPASAFFRQILSTYDRVYVNLWDQSFVNKDRVEVMCEVSLEPYADGFSFSLVGRPFHENRLAYQPFGDNLKRRFITQLDAQNIAVAHQLQPTIWTYQIAKAGVSGPTQLQRLKLENYETPFLPRPSPEIPGYCPFSQIVGLFSLKEGLLIGYMSPMLNDEETKKYCGSIVGKGYLPRHVLYLQRFDRDNQKSRTAVKMPGGFLLGVDIDSEAAFVLRRIHEPFQFEICLMKI